MAAKTTIIILTTRVIVCINNKLMSPERSTESKMLNPNESRKRTMQFIYNFGRDTKENPETPAQPVPIREVVKFAQENKLFFGADADVVDYVLSKSVLGIIDIDERNNVIFRGATVQKSKPTT